MDESLDDIYRRMRITKLEARLESIEIERGVLQHEIDSPLTSPDRKAEAIARQDDLLSKGAEIVEELKILKKPKEGST